jgi:catechol 2,3-dioxygenase-like lactoylglutathione lyase family enzyme
LSAEPLRGVAPVFPVSDVDSTAGWYRDVLSFEFDTFPKTDLSSHREGGVWDVYIQVSGLPSLWDRVSTLPGARGSEDRWYGQREVEIRDPNGYVLAFAEETTAVAS